MFKSRIDNPIPALPEGYVLISNIPQYKECRGYAINTDGKIISCKAHNFKHYCFEQNWKHIKIKLNNFHGYYFVTMSCFGKDITVTLHRLLACAFIPNPENKKFINHIDANKQNNKLENLEWCTPQENSKHYISLGLRDTAKGSRLPSSKLKEEDIISIFKYRENGMLHKEIAALFKVDTSVITRVLNRQRWKHVTT